MPGFGISINMEWEEGATDHSICYECKQMIFGKMHTGYFFVDNVAIGAMVTVCDVCRYNNEDEPQQ